MQYTVQPDGRWLFRFDNHSISTFSTCEKLFEYTLIRNQRRKGGTQFNTAVGIWWSAVMSDLYEGIAANQAKGRMEPPPLDDVLVSAALHWHKQRLSVYETLAPSKYNKFAGDQNLDVPLPDSTVIKIPIGALAMAEQYYENRAASDAKHWRILATETAFGVLDDLIIGGDSKVIVAYQGRPDIVALDAGGRLMPLDHKSKDYPDPASALFEFKPHSQMQGYVFSLNALVQTLGMSHVVDRCLIIMSGRYTPAEPRDKKKPKKPRFIEIMVHYSQAELNEWRDETIAKARRLRDAIERHHFLRKESSCHFMYGAPCSFRPVCSAPPGAREMLLRRDYETLRPWNTGAPEERDKK